MSPSELYHRVGVEARRNSSRGPAAIGWPRDRWRSSSSSWDSPRSGACSTCRSRSARDAAAPSAGCGDDGFRACRPVRPPSRSRSCGSRMRTPRGRSHPGGTAPDLHRLLGDDLSQRRHFISGAADRQRARLATFGCFVCLFSILPLAMNQFAIDKAGFTRYMLSPLSIRELLQGKAVGNALIAGGPAVCCFVLPALVFRGGSLAMWLALLFSVIATYMLRRAGGGRAVGDLFQAPSISTASVMRATPIRVRRCSGCCRSSAQRRRVRFWSSSRRGCSSDRRSRPCSSSPGARWRSSSRISCSVPCVDWSRADAKRWLNTIDW